MKIRSFAKKRKWSLLLYTVLLTSMILVTSMPVYAAGNTPVDEADLLDVQNIIEEIPEESIPTEEPALEEPEIDGSGGLKDLLPDATVAPEEPPTDPDANAVATTCTVRFGNNAGTNIYAGYTMTVAYGTTITLPEVPKTTGYRNRGWAFTAHSEPTHFPGDSYKVTGDVLFHAVRVQQFTVKFNNNSGTTVAPVYDTLTMVVDRDSKVILPAVPKASGYKNLGWTTVVNSPTVTNEAGSQYTVTGDITFYAVRKKLAQYTIKFNNNSGTNMGSPYDAMTMIVQEGSSVTLPDLPAAKGYTPLGWTTTVNSLVVTNKAGTSYTPTHDVTFYTVRMRVFSTRFYDVNGKVLSSLNQDTNRGVSIILPSTKNPSGKTILGWQDESGNRFDFGETIIPTDDTKYYPRYITNTSLKKPAIVSPSSKYSRIVFVGDSRTKGMQTRIGGQISSKFKFVCESGKGLSWLKNNFKDVKSALGTDQTARTAIIFNFGINDITTKNYSDANFPNCLNAYRSYMSTVKNELQSYNCDLYYMSLNPINNAVLTSLDHNSRPEERVLEFNEMLKALPGYTYIDSYRQLTDTGLVYAQSGNLTTDIDDGVHYNTATYTKIYNICVNQLNK